MNQALQAIMPHIDEKYFKRTWKDWIFSKEAFCGLCLTTASIYLYCYLTLKKAIKVAYNQNAWCNWNCEDSLENADDQSLHEKLFTDIQTRYFNNKKPTDYLEPLNLFLEDYRSEKIILERYFTLLNWIQKLHLKRIFTIQKEDFFHIKERVSRLKKIKMLFFKLTTQHKKKHYAG